jgi:hypothetical protein
MPPQQADGLLDLVDDGQDFGAHDASAWCGLRRS